MPYTKTGLLTGDTITQAYLDHIETQYDESQKNLLAARAEHYAAQASQALAIWNLESRAIATENGLTNFHGEPFLSVKNNVAAMGPYLKVSRGATPGLGFVEGFSSIGFDDLPLGPHNGDLNFNTGTTTWGPSTVYYDPILNMNLVGGYVVNGTATQGYFAGAAPTSSPTGGGLTDLGLPPVNGQTSSVSNVLTFTPNFSHVMVKNSAATPFLKLYRRDGAAAPFTWTAVGTVPTTVAGMNNEVHSFDPTGAYYAVGVNASPYIAVYSRSVDTMTKLANPGTALVTPGSLSGLIWTPDGKMLWASYSSTSSMYAWSFNGGTVTSDGSGGTWGQYYAGHGWLDSTTLVVLMNGLGGASIIAVYTYNAAAKSLTQVSGVTLDVVPTGTVFNQFALDPNRGYIVFRVANGKYWSYKWTGSTFVFKKEMVISGTVVRPAFSADGMFWYYGNDTAMNDFSGTGATSANTSSITLTTKALTKPCNSVLITDDVAQTVGSGTYSRAYDVSLNGGTTWDTVSAAEVGTLKLLNHSGSSLVIRVNINRQVGAPAADRYQVRTVTGFAGNQ